MMPEDLKAWREARGLSQSDLARLLPISLRTLQEWEAARGKGRPPEFIERALRDLDRELKWDAEPLPWSRWYEQAREDAAIRYGMQRVPVDFWKSMWAQGHTPHEAAKYARGQYPEKARA